MDAHHYVSLHEISDDREKVKDISNGVTLCVPCHTKFHKQYGSKGNTREQFEEYAYFEKEYKVKCNTISQQLEQIRS